LKLINSVSSTEYSALLAAQYLQHADIEESKARLYAAAPVDAVYKGTDRLLKTGVNTRRNTADTDFVSDGFLADMKVGLFGTGPPFCRVELY